RLLIWAAGVGLLAGGVALLFGLAADELPARVWGPGPSLARAVAGCSPFWRLLVPTLGGLLAGLVLARGTRYSAPARGWDILEAVTLRDGVLHLRPALVRGLSSLLTVASAGPVGREGPMVLLSAAVSSRLGRSFGVPTRQLRILVGCGVAAGIACAYNTPIGAALFTMEIIIGSFALDVFAPLVFASVAATLLAHARAGSLPLFPLPDLALVSFWEIAFSALLGVLGGLTAALFLQALRGAAALFRRSRLSRPLAMGAAGFVLGLVILEWPQVVGNGRDAIGQMLTERWSVPLALGLLVARLGLTSLTVGAGTVGGVFTPTLFLGAALGEAFGALTRALGPAWVGAPEAYCVVGMAALLAGTTHAPLTAAVMLFEMTLDYNIVLPLLVAAAAASLVARGLSRESIYTEALRRKRATADDSPEAAVIRTLTVADVMRSEQTTVPADLELPRVLDRFIATRRNHLYVVDGEGRFEGGVSLQDANRRLRESEAPQEVRARDLLIPRFPSAVRDERLDGVLERFWAEECERLPVLDGAESRRLVGTISQRDILSVYSLEVLHRRSPLTRFDAADGARREST
ncbi:MAG TPA: chloride channel protein, partial [Candidatus Polarisedimenticolaceae bacterium]|nr:chloride channel protein [Candidatus Polarisedimenticolaceae bacterium]